MNKTNEISNISKTHVIIKRSKISTASEISKTNRIKEIQTNGINEIC